MALMSTSGTGHEPLRLYRWSDRLQQFNFRLQLTCGRHNTIADHLSRSVMASDTSFEPEDTAQDLIQLLHGPLHDVVSLPELQQACKEDSLLCTLRSYIMGGWPA